MGTFFLPHVGSSRELPTLAALPCRCDTAAPRKSIVSVSSPCTSLAPQPVRGDVVSFIRGDVVSFIALRLFRCLSPSSPFSWESQGTFGVEMIFLPG